MRITLVIAVTLAASFFAGLAISSGSDASTAARHQGGVGVIATPAALGDSPSSPIVEAAKRTGLPERTIEQLKLKPTTVRRIATFALTREREHRVFLGERRDGWTCLVDDVTAGTTPDGRPLRVSGGSCSPRMFAKQAAAIKIGTSLRNGNPEGEWHVVGVAAPHVGRLVVIDSAGNEYPVQVNAANAFRFQMSEERLAAGDRPVRLALFSQSGEPISDIALR
jgi:hypothetical protein